MKKIISLLLTALLVFSLSGCKSGQSEIRPITKGITFAAEITYYNEYCEGTVSVDENGKMNIEITFPDTVKGLTLTFDGGGIKAEYAGLEYEISSLPEGIACGRLYEILEDTFSEDVKVTADGDESYIAGAAGDSEYRMYLGATGLPISAEDINGTFCVNFKNVTITEK